MTICNMTIEGGGRAGHDRPRRHHVRLGEGRAGAPAGATSTRRRGWRELRTDEGAAFDREVVVDAAALVAAGHLGHDPRDGRRRHRGGARAARRERGAGAASTWTSSPARRSRRSALDRVFIGSCTNSRIGDLRAAAEVVEGRTRRRRRRRDGRARLRSRSRPQAEAEGLDEVFRAAGFDWRSAGCSMCLGMNPDIARRPASAAPRPRTATSRGARAAAARTHLVSPADGRRRRDRGALRRHPRLELSAMEPITIVTGRRHRARPRRRRHRPDHPQAVPQARRAHRLRRVPLLRLGARSPAGTCPRNPILVAGRNFGCGSLARARAVGAGGLRLPRDRRAELRRHLLLQLHEDRAAAGRARPRTTCAR